MRSFSSACPNARAFAELGANVTDKLPMSLPKIKLEMPNGEIPFAEADDDEGDSGKTPHAVSDVILLEVETIEVEPEEVGEESKVPPKVTGVAQERRSPSSPP